MNTFVYIDGFNLYYGAVKGTPYKWLDIHQVNYLIDVETIKKKISDVPFGGTPRGGWGGSERRLDHLVPDSEAWMSAISTIQPRKQWHYSSNSSA
jgi:hypothetical protein